MSHQPHISIVTPVYGCKPNLHDLYQRLCSSLTPITRSFEIIMVNDRSPDNAWEVIQELAGKDDRVRGINLSRNFGQHYAITAGLDYVRGDWCVVMDCDLQDQPEEIPRLYREAQKGYDIVKGRRANRKDSWLNRFTSRLFYRLFNYLTGQKLDNTIANFGIYKRKVIETIKHYRERDRSFGLLVTLVGYNWTVIDVEHANRTCGSSAYSFRSRFKMAENHILTHSTKLLRISVNIGLTTTIVAFLYAIYLLVRYLLFSATMPGWNSLMVSIFFLFGILMIMFGIVGLYVGKIYDEIKGRPLFITDSTTFETEEQS